MSSLNPSTEDLSRRKAERDVQRLMDVRARMDPDDLAQHDAELHAKIDAVVNGKP